ncbi:hypothetical protein PNH38_05495 [Anoxybacillus rupiensis]|uniref:Uncharacterized protein n=1 Tax=Anoxybacteroides rupiense TaxID=311460 RepID=A0ABD5IZS3_9BACL|nr:CBO0543 family protein [Anoxybacillus rupiensis]MDE8563341.1 hypothetical protein [Anoxybacillus rupiensis]MED5053149.1 hypothetical protein [Anoxybacillus rupiensis]
MWILYFSIIVFNLIAIMMKKKLMRIEYYSCILFALFTSEIVDRFAEKYDLYGFFYPFMIEAKTLLVLFGIYPAASMLIINWYPYDGTWKKKSLYLLGWSIFSTFYEWLAVRVGFLYHHHWNLWYSAISYPFLYGMLLLQVSFFRRLSKADMISPKS